MNFSPHLLHHIQLVDPFLVHNLDCHLDTGYNMSSNFRLQPLFQSHALLCQRNHSPKSFLIDRVQGIHIHQTWYSQKARGIHLLLTRTTITTSYAERRFVVKITLFHDTAKRTRANRRKPIIMQSNWPTALSTSQSTRSLHSQESTPVEEETPMADGSLQEFVEIETASISEKVRTLQIAYNDYVEAEQV